MYYFKYIENERNTKVILTLLTPPPDVLQPAFCEGVLACRCPSHRLPPSRRPVPAPRREEQPTPLEKIREAAKSGRESSFKPEASKDEEAPTPRRSGRGLDILV